MSDASGMNLGSETLKGTIARFGMAASGFVGTVVFARLLEPSSFGAFYLLFTIVKVADRPISGWAEAGKKRFSEAGSSPGQIAGAQLIFYGVWISVASVAASLLSSHLQAVTGLDAALAMFLVVFIADPLFEIFERLVQARGRLGTSTTIDAIRSYLTLGGQLLLVLAGFGAAGLAYGLAGATLLSVPLVVHFAQVNPEWPTKTTVEQIASFAKYSIPREIIGVAYSQLGKLLLGFFLVSTSAVAYYQVALTLTIPAMFVADVAGSGLMARVSHLRSKNEEVRSDITNTLAFSSIIAIPMLMGAIALAEPVVVTFYGPEYAAAAPLLVGLAIYRLIRTQSRSLSHMSRGFDRPDIDARALTVAIVVNFTLGVLLINTHGTIGIVVAFISAEAVRYGILVLFLKNEVPAVTVIPRSIGEQFAAAVVMLIVVWVARDLVGIGSWIELTLIVLFGGAIYGLFLLSISTHFRTTAVAIVESMGAEHYVPDRLLKR